MNQYIKELLILLFFASYCYGQTCSSVGGLQTYYDPSCAQGGVGCNAGGQLNCRFCGFDVYPPCPTTGTTTTTTTTTRTTGTTTPRTTTTRDPNQTPGTGIPVTYEPELPDGMVFYDDFDKFDLRKWKHDITLSGGGNWEFQLYHNNRSNSFVKDGILHIAPTLLEDRIGAANLRGNYRMDLWGGSPVDQCTGNNFYGCERTSGAGGNIINPIQSAKITTVSSFSIKYGRVEVRAKLPQGDWLWPAIWLLPADNAYGQWPASGEIDIMESRGNLNYPTNLGGGVESFGSTLHWGPDWSQNGYPFTSKEYHHSEPLSNDFHIYGLYWDETGLYTYIDDDSNKVLEVDMTQQGFFERGKFPSSYDNPWKDSNINAPFDQRFYIIINLAVGGTGGYFNDKAPGKPWSNASPNSVNEFYNAKNTWYPTWKKNFEIDWVKVWRV